MAREVNFKCKVTGFEFFVPVHSTKYKGKKVIYVCKNKEIECPDCKSTNIEPIKTGELTSNIGSFTMMSLEQKQKHLTERSRKHSLKYTNQEM